MNLLLWNVRGFNNPLKQKGVMGRIKEHNIQVVCLLETRVKEIKSQSIIDKHFQGWSLIHNYLTAYNGRIWFLWKEQVQVDLVALTDQCITCNISFGSFQFHLSAVYGLNDGVERRRLWDHLCNLNSALSQKPWIIAGDFNVIAHPSESSNYTGAQLFNSDIIDFRECLQKLALQDHAFTRQLLTWSNRQRGVF